MQIRLFVLLLWGMLATCSAWAQEYAVSLSGSGTDPSVNHLQSLPGENFSVYLWLNCSTGSGASSFEGIVSTSYTVTGFDSLGGVLEPSSPPTYPRILLQNCPQPPFLIGRWDLRNAQQDSSGFVCLELPWNASPSCVVTDCSILGGIQDALAGVTGFSVGAAEPCTASNGCEIE